MSNCCSIDPNAERTPCPVCDTTGPTVGDKPVKAHRPDAADGQWQHCATADCPVVYYMGDDTVTTDQVKAQVAHKALDKPEPVCFCFAHTADDIAADLEANDGTSTIKADVKAAVADGFCACEFLNPSTKCCLSDIHRTIKKIEASKATH